MSTSKDYVGYISFSHSLTDRQVHVDSWDEAYSCSEGCGGSLEKLVHRKTGIVLYSEPAYETFVKENICEYYAQFIVNDASLFNTYSEDVYDWDEAMSIAKSKDHSLVRLIHKESSTLLSSREHYNHFSSLYHCNGDLDVTHTIIPSDVEDKPSYTDEQKQSIIADMLLHFKSVHDKRNQELIDSGYGNDTIPFDEVSVQELKDYALSGTVWGKI